MTHCPAVLVTDHWKHTCDRPDGHEGEHDACEFGLDDDSHEAMWAGPAVVIDVRQKVPS